MIRSLCLKLLYAGIDGQTPELLINRLLFSNAGCLIAIIFSIALGIVNFAKGYTLLMAMDVFYLLGGLACLYLCHRRFYLTSRVAFLSQLFLGMLFSCLYQGRVYEIEHFFIPFAVAGFCIFTSEERIFSFVYMIIALALYFILMERTNPLFSSMPGHFTEGDRVINRITYLSIFGVLLFALSSTFDRAMHVISNQRAKLFEDRKMAMMGAMACNVAHEINSPLAALDLHLYELDNMAKSGELTPQEVDRRLQKMVGISRRISVIVRGLKFLSRQEDNDPMSMRSIGTIIDSAFDLNRDRIDKHDIRFDLRLESSEERILCRPVALSQVFLNLLNNSVDAVQDKPRENRWITISARRNQKFLEVSVEDGGAILNAETRANLFKTFYTTKPAGKGTGLGLSISKETVEAHDGKLQFDETCQHTRFVVALPLGSAHSPKEEGCA